MTSYRHDMKSFNFLSVLFFFEYTRWPGDFTKSLIRLTNERANKSRAKWVDGLLKKIRSNRSKQFEITQKLSEIIRYYLTLLEQ